MDEFEIPVIWKGKEWSFPAQLQQFGFSHRIVVDVNGVQVQLEPDEERNYRAIVIDPDHEAAKQLDPALIGAIVEVVESLVK